MGCNRELSSKAWKIGRVKKRGGNKLVVMTLPVLNAMWIPALQRLSFYSCLFIQVTSYADLPFLQSVGLRHFCLLSKQHSFLLKTVFKQCIFKIQCIYIQIYIFRSISVSIYLYLYIHIDICVSIQNHKNMQVGKDV